MAAKFEMDPQATSTGLTGAGLTASQSIAAGIPQLPVGNYTAGYMTALGALLGAWIADAEGLVTQGLATSAGSVAAVEGTEGPNAASLTI
jgi:hypothetical protein